MAKDDKAATRAATREAKEKVAEKKAELRAVKKAASEEVKALKKQRSASRRDLQATAKGTGSSHKQKQTAAAMRRERERFPRLEAEAERRVLRLPTRGDKTAGPRALYRSSAHSKFPPFRSALRIDLEHTILEAPLAPGHGAGLDLHALVNSGRVHEVIYVHDDDEVEEIRKTLVLGTAGVLPLSRRALQLVHGYTGAEVGFYFAWVSAYTRSLWLPALLGGALWLSDVQFFDAALLAERNISAAEVSTLFAAERSTAGFQRSILQMLFGLAIILWSSGFDEMWKRRQATIATQWGEVGATKPPPSLNPTFKATQVRSGFYTEEGLWVSLEARLTSKEASKQQQGGGGGDGSAPSERTSDRSGRLPLLAALPPSLPKPKDVWFPTAERMKRQYAAAIVTVIMSLGCLACIFFMQLFSAWARANPGALGGNAGTAYSLSNAVMITSFNIGWRTLALKLCTWENYRLQPRYREMLTYKLFIFQCINCYFTLLYTAFFKPFGVKIFGLDMGVCEVRPKSPDVLSCADEVRQLLYALLFANILVGQATEVGTAVFGVISKKITAHIKNKITDRKEAAQAKANTQGRVATTTKTRKGKGGAKVQEPWKGGADAEANEAGDEPDVESNAPPNSQSTSGRHGPTLEEVARKRKAGQRLSTEEARLYEDQRKVIDLIGEFERPLVKSEKQGLGSTFYEYNELALQYGYLVLFSILLPAAPVLALVNNLIEIRSDAFKTIYASRRTRAEAACDIGPWSRALKTLSFLGLACNLALLAVTSDFFDQLALYAPWFEATGARLGTAILAEHLLGLKLLIDFVVPDVPSKVRVRLHREEYVSDALVSLVSAAPAAIGPDEP